MELTISIRGKTLRDIRVQVKAEASAAEAREHRIAAERRRRTEARDAAEEEEAGKYRRGSAHRRQYTFKDKVQILAVFDEINGDVNELHKVAEFHKDPRARGTPYTTVRTHWASAEQRANINTGFNRERASTLLRFDKTSRKVGKFANMEKDLHALFVARRARGRRVSARWLSSTARTLMKKLYPEHANDFKGGQDWRRRFAKRFALSQRRKTNVKNKTWAETEPVLLRYFSTLRKRLQLDGADELPPDDELEPEAEPEDLDVEVVAPDGAFDDSSDDEDPADELVSLETAIPAGFKVAELPNGSDMDLLVYKGERAEELVGRTIIFNWRGVGWVDGKITRPNTDGRVKLKVGDVQTVVNYFVYYSDQTEARHCLTLDTYGDQGEREDGRWVLLGTLRSSSLGGRSEG